MFLSVLRWLWHRCVEPWTENYEPCGWCDGAYLGRPGSPKTRLCWVWCEARPWGGLTRLCKDHQEACAAG